jgi:cell surface protein SprA
LLILPRFQPGKTSTIGFGALEQGPNERSRRIFNNITNNVNPGKMLPVKWELIAFYYAVGEETITPEYDPFNRC